MPCLRGWRVMPCASSQGLMSDGVSSRGTVTSMGSIGCREGGGQHLEAVQEAFHSIDLPAQRPLVVGEVAEIAELAEHLSEGLDGHQRVPDLVDHAGGDGLDRGQALGPLALPDQLLDPGEADEGAKVRRLDMSLLSDFFLTRTAEVP